MSWENHGQWHIDHITPLNYGNPTIEEQIKRLHWTNTQPLWRTDNRLKGDKIDGNDILLTKQEMKLFAQ